MVKITDMTEENIKKRKSLEEKAQFFKKHFKEKENRVLIHQLWGISLNSLNKNENPLLYLDLSFEPNLNVYTTKISDEKLIGFGEDYEKTFGIKDFKIKKDYSGF